jgi:hypothetical protein
MPVNTTADRNHWRLSFTWFQLLQASAGETVIMDLVSERTMRAALSSLPSTFHRMRIYRRSRLVQRYLI